jgi:hypothetical protein
MKFIIAALLVLSPISHAEQTQKLDPEIEKLFKELLDVESLLEPSLESQAQNALYSGIQKNLIEAANVNPLILPIMLAICEDKRAQRIGQQKFRIDVSDLTEVAEYDASMYAMSSFIAFAKSEEVSNQQEATDITFANFQNEALFHCVDDSYEDLKKTTIAVPSAELIRIVQFDIINRAKKVLGEWNFLMGGKAVDSYNLKAGEYFEDTVRKIQNAIEDKQQRNSIGSTKVRAAKYSPPPIRTLSRGSI